MFKKQTHPPWCKIQNNYFYNKALWIWYFSKVKTNLQWRSKTCLMFGSFYTEDQTIFNGLLKPSGHMIKNQRELSYL